MATTADLLPRVELDDPAGAVVAEPGDDHAVAGLEPRAGLGQAGVVLGLALEVGQALVEGLAAPLGLGLGGERRLPGRPRRPCGASGRSAISGSVLARLCFEVLRRAGDQVLGQVQRRAIWRAFDWPMSPMWSR